MAIIYFLQEFFFDGSIYLSASGSYNKVAIFPAIYFTRPSSSGALLNSMTSSLNSPVALLFMCYIIPQIPNTVNLRRLFSFIRHKIKIVIIFIICRMMCATYFLPRVHIYLWEKSVSIGELGVNFRGVNSVNFWNI